MSAWYEAKTGNHQGLVVEEATGRNVAVSYDKVDARLIAAAPDLLAALQALLPIGYNDGPLAEAYRSEVEAAERAIARATHGE